MERQDDFEKLINEPCEYEIPRLRYEIALYIYQCNVSFPTCVSKTMPKCGSIIRSSHRRYSIKKDVNKNFAKSTGKHLKLQA